MMAVRLFQYSTRADLRMIYNEGGGFWRWFTERPAISFQCTFDTLFRRVSVHRRSTSENVWTSETCDRRCVGPMFRRFVIGKIRNRSWSLCFPVRWAHQKDGQHLWRKDFPKLSDGRDLHHEKVGRSLQRRVSQPESASRRLLEDKGAIYSWAQLTELRKNTTMDQTLLSCKNMFSTWASSLQSPVVWSWILSGKVE